MNVLITGGAGFIGSHLVDYHLKNNDAVWVVDNLQTGQLNNLAHHLKDPNFSFSDANLLTWSNLESAIGWSERIYHMAANVGQHNVIKSPVETLTNNIEGLHRVLDAMKNVNTKTKILIASTSCVYDHLNIGPKDKLSENDILKIPSHSFLQETYPLSKITNEVMALSYAHEYGLQCTIARIFNTIGPRQSARYGMVASNFVKQAIKGEPITVFGTGDQMRSFCSVMDTTTALVSLLNHAGSIGEIINVGNDNPVSINELAKLVKKLTNSSSDIIHIPYKKAYGIDFHDIMHRVPSLEKLRKLTGFVPAYSLEDTLKNIINN